MPMKLTDVSKCLRKINSVKIKHYKLMKVLNNHNSTIKNLSKTPIFCQFQLP